MEEDRQANASRIECLNKGAFRLLLFCLKFLQSLKMYVILSFIETKQAQKARHEKLLPQTFRKHPLSIRSLHVRNCRTSCRVCSGYLSFPLIGAPVNKKPLIVFIASLLILVCIIGLSLFDVWHDDDITFSLTWLAIITAALSFPFIPKD